MSGSFWSSKRLTLCFTDGHDGQRNVVVDRPYAIVGSSNTCDVTLSSKKVARHAILFLATHIGIRAVVLSGKSKHAGRIMRVEPGHPISIGRFAVDVRAEDGDEGGLSINPPPVVSCEDDGLHVATWQSEGARRFLRIRRNRPLIVGRKFPSDIQISDERMSGQHACLLWQADRLWVIDLNSANGTFLGRESIACGGIPVGKSVTMGRQRIHFVKLHTADTIQELREGQQRAREELSREQAVAIAELRAQHAEISDALAQLKASSRSQDAQLAQSQATIQSLCFEVEDREREQRKLRDSLNACHKQEEELRDRLRCQQSERQELQAEIAFRTSETQQVTARLVETNSRLSEAESSRDQMQLCIDQLQQELAKTKLLLESDAIRVKEAELESLRNELLSEREILKQFQADVTTSPEIEAAPIDDDETCISSFDFQEVLEEAMEGLPAIDED